MTINIYDAFHGALREIGTREGKFLSSSGEFLEQYFDIRAVALQRPGVVRAFMLEKLHEFNFDVVVSTGVGGAILLGLVAPIGINGVIYNPKQHGILWSPAPPKDKKVVVLDDVRTTGHTLAKLRDAVEEEGGFVVGEVSLVNREEYVQALESTDEVEIRSNN